MTTKIALFLLILTVGGLSGCKTTRVQLLSAAEPGMFKVVILYPGGEGKTFDMSYYEQKHMPMVAGMLGENLRFYEIDKGISGRTTADKTPFLAIGYFYVASIDEYNKAVATNRDAIVSDFKNYTNTQPVIQIAEIKAIVNPKSK